MPGDKETQVGGLNERRDFERERYEAIYSGKVRTQPHKRFYGVRNHGKEAWPKLKEFFPIASILDVGTGDGGFPRQCVDAGIPEVYGLDFASIAFALGRTAQGKYARIKWLDAPAHRIPLPTRSIEWVTAFDTLEHFLPEEVDEAIREMCRVSSVGLFFSISYIPSHEVMGANLHRTIQPKEWWIEKLSHFGTVKEYTDKYLYLV